MRRVLMPVYKADMQRLLILLLAALGSCSLAVPASKPNPPLELAGLAAGKPQSCISIRLNERLSPLDEYTLVYRSGHTLWVNRLDGPCRGLDPVNIVIIERNGTQVCRGDHLRVVEPPLTVPGPICILGDFVPYR